MRKIAIAMLVAATIGCTPGDFLVYSGEPCLTVEETVLGPGAATGDEYSGQYEVVSGVIEACRVCGSNTNRSACSNFSTVVEPGAIIEITQNGGRIELVGGGDRANGWLDADGTFSVGIVKSVGNSSGQRIGQGAVLFDGHFSGDLVIVNTTFHTTSSENGVVTDTQLTGETTYRLIE